MNKLFTAVLLGTAILLSGCETIRAWFSSPTAAAVVQTAVRSGTAYGVRQAVTKKPELRPTLEKIHKATAIAIDTGVSDPEALRASIVAGIKDDHLRGDALTVVSLALDTYSRFYKLNVSPKVDRSPVFKATLVAFVDGLGEGLATAPLKPAAPGKGMAELTDKDMTL